MILQHNLVQVQNLTILVLQNSTAMCYDCRYKLYLFVCSVYFNLIISQSFDMYLNNIIKTLLFSFRQIGFLICPYVEFYKKRYKQRYKKRFEKKKT